MAITANIAVTPPIDGVVYARSVPLTSTEAVLSDGVQVAANIPVVQGQEIVAVVSLTINGLIVGNNAYVVLQTDLNDTWVDLAWLVATHSQGTARWVLCAGGCGTINNSFQQSRGVGAFPTPQTVGSNQAPLGSRIRFVGKATLISGSSSIAGTTPQVLANILYRIQNPI